MRFLFLGILVLFLGSCDKKEVSHNYTSVEVETIFSDSLSIRAIEVMQGSLAFAANKGIYGMVDLKAEKVKTNIQLYDSIIPEYRSIAHTATDFFMLSVANPALLYKTGDTGQMELVYMEEDPAVFYDAMVFMDNENGIAVGDSMNGCLSLLRTKDGGDSWNKIPCTKLPEADPGEGAFAASNTNIVAVGTTLAIATTSGRIFLSNDKGENWTTVQSPIVNKEPTQGIYTMDFYDENLGIVMGGDYTKPDDNTANKAITTDGGKNWILVADGQDPGYTSCVQFVPGSGGKDLVAVGSYGISYSNGTGKDWKNISDQPFYTIRFLNDSIAYAAGKNRIAKITFR